MKMVINTNMKSFMKIEYFSRMRKPVEIDMPPKSWTVNII